MPWPGALVRRSPPPSCWTRPDHRQCQTGALADALGRIQGLNGAATGLCVHSHPDVAHEQTDMSAGLDRCIRRSIDVVVKGRHLQPPACGHGVLGADRQVEESHLDLVLIGQGHCPVRR